MTLPPRASESVGTTPLGTAELLAFSTAAAACTADELRAALAPGIQVLRPLGAGAMGLVFLGRDPLLKRLVAIKVLAPDLANDEIARGRFVRESEASAAVTHPNVAGVYLVGELPVRRTPYFVMQFIDGRSLADEIASGVATSELRARRLIGEIAAALEAAHARGLVHRDVKPANIIIENATDRPVVLDFGISAVLQRDAPGDPRLTTAGSYVGTPTYMSPEQATGEPVTGKSDVYGLGLIAFELLSGKPPFDGPAVVVMAAHVERPAPSLHVVRPGIDEHLAELVDRCLRKDPAERPTAGDVAHALVPGTRSLLEWTPPGLDTLRGRGTRLIWCWAAVCVVALLFFLFLHLRPPVASPQWAEGEQSGFWGGLVMPTDVSLSDGGRGNAGGGALAADATAVWMFLVSASVAMLGLAVLVAMSYSAQCAYDATRAARDGYPWSVLFDVAWDRYEDTAMLLNASGVYALSTPGQRATMLGARRTYAVAGIVMVGFGVLMPVLWMTGVLRAHESSSEIVTQTELLLLALPLLVGLGAAAVLKGRTRLAIGRRRRWTGVGTAMQADLVSAWLAVAGRGERTTARTGRWALAVLLSVVATGALVAVSYVIVVVFLVTLVSTTQLAAGRTKAEAWRSSFLVDSTRPMRLSELDMLARHSGIPSVGTAPDTEAARLLVARPYVVADTLSPPPAFAMDLAGARELVRGSAPEQRVPVALSRALGDSVLPSSAVLAAMEPFAQSPWLATWRRFAASPDYPLMWQYRRGLPGASYLWNVPIMRYVGVKEMAYGNSFAGLIALSKGDVATATRRGRETIAGGRHFLNSTTVIDNLIGQVVIGIGRSELLTVARTTGDAALHDEMVRLRTSGLRWRSQRVSSMGMMAMVADPDSREAIRYVAQLESSAHFGELMYVASAGFCDNTRELLFGSDSARYRLLHAIGAASGNPRAPELEVLSNRWLTDITNGTVDRSLGRRNERERPMRLLAPLAWLGMRGFQDRARVCLLGGLN